MSVIETLTFQLAPGTAQSAFLEADQRVQTDFFYRQPGLARRTTARGGDGEWLVVVLWALTLSIIIFRWRSVQIQNYGNGFVDPVRQFGQVEIPQEAFIAALKMDEN